MADGIKSRAELVTEGLSLLGVLAAGQTPSAEDYDTVDDQIEPTLATLRTLYLTSVDDYDAIPDEEFNQIAAQLAENCLVKFGIVSDEKMRIQEAARMGRDTLRMIIASGPTYGQQAVDYF